MKRKSKKKFDKSIKTLKISLEKCHKKIINAHFGQFPKILILKIYPYKNKQISNKRNTKNKSPCDYDRLKEEQNERIQDIINSETNKTSPNFLLQYIQYIWPNEQIKNQDALYSQTKQLQSNFSLTKKLQDKLLENQSFQKCLIFVPKPLIHSKYWYTYVMVRRECYYASKSMRSQFDGADLNWLVSQRFEMVRKKRPERKLPKFVVELYHKKLLRYHQIERDAVANNYQLQPYQKLLIISDWILSFSRENF